MKKTPARCVIFCTLLFFGYSEFPLHADSVVLKNGSTLDCDIIAEYPDHVEVSMGSGSITLRKSQIEKLVKSDPSAATGKNSTRSKGKIYSAQNAPEAYADLAAGFRLLVKKRNEAMDARYMINLHERETAKLEENIKRLSDEITGLKRELTAKSEQIAAIKLPDSTPQTREDINAYNQLIAQKQKLVDESNAVFARIGPLEEQCIDAGNKIIETKAKYRTDVQPIVLYQTALRDFLSEYAERKQTIPKHPDEPTRELFTTLDRFLDRFQNEMPTHMIHSEQVGDSTIVRALVNGTTVGEFVFDTGATVMTISESFAKKLGINIECLPVTEIVVADGSVVEVKALRLKSVAVGDADASNVDACVVPDSPNTPEDGLLGMSFLKRFAVGINGTTGEIELTELQGGASD